MKNLFKSIMTVAVAAMALTACSNSFEEVAPVQTSKFTVNAVAEDMTRTAFGEPADGKYPTLWSGSETVKVAINATKDAKSTKTTVSSDKSSASFAVSIETGEVSAPYTFAALSPESAVVSDVNASFKSWNIEFPTTQTPTANSCDPKAQILLGTSTTYEAMPSSVDLSFKHLSAYAKFSLINLNIGNATVNSVTMESEKTIAYRHYYYLAGTKAGTFEDNGATNVITINTSSLENIWVGLAPTDVSNSKLTFTVNTSAGTYTKEVTMLANRVFEAGKVSTFKVDMTGVELEGPVKYELLTNVTDLTPGTKAIIAAAKSNYAMSTNQKSSNRGSAAITKDGNYIVDPGSDVEIFTVEEGTVAGTYSFKGKAGYIYAAASGSNHLKTQATNNANSSWLITIENAGTKMVAKGTNTNNVLRYNPNNGSPLFSCYGSTSTTGELVAIYYIPGAPSTDPAIIPANNTLNISHDTTEAEVDLTLKNLTEEVSVDWREDWITDAWIEDEILFLNFTANQETTPREAVVTLSANGAEATVTITQKGKAAPATEITIKEFLEKSVDANIEYTLRGTITRVVNTTYGNFDITDETGTVYIYGLCSPEGAQKYWAASGAKLGDDIVIKTVRAEYNGTAQGSNAKFVELITPGTLPFYTVDYSVVQLPYTGGSSEVNISVHNTTATITATSNNPAITASVNGYKVTISGEANETEQAVEGVVTIKVGDLTPTEVTVSIAAKPAEGEVAGGSDDFNTITSTNTSYVSSTTKAGWKAENCAIFKGGTSDASPAFKMIGDDTNRAFCMNGKTTAVGTITSPTLTTGCGTLKFNYGLPFGDNKIKFRVDIKQNGTVVKTFTVNPSSVTKLTKYSHEETINVAGDFQIVFTNLSPSSSTSNKDRTAIWDVEWTGYKN